MNITSVDQGELHHGVLLKDARRECMAPRGIFKAITRVHYEMEWTAGSPDHRFSPLSLLITVFGEPVPVFPFLNSRLIGRVRILTL